jgi:sugar phosphate isomerase/epimerase
MLARFGTFDKYEAREAIIRVVSRPGATERAVTGLNPSEAEMITRRNFLQGSAAGLAIVPAVSRLWAAEPRPPKIRISCCHTDFADAKKSGLDGVELNVGGPAERLRIADPEVRAKYREQMKETGLATSSFMMGLFNSHPLATDPRAPAWMDQAIEAAKDLGAQTILLAFFGKGDLKKGRDLKKEDIDSVVERVRAAAPKAKEAGVFLGIENTLSAGQNLEILQRIGHDSVRIYYDCYNLTGEGYDVPAEIRLLKDRISIFHFKNGPDYLESGKMKWEPIVESIREIKYEGWIVLETSCPSKDRVADDRKNADYVRKLFGIGS